MSLGKMGLGPHPVYGFNETLVVSEIANLGYLNSRTFSLTFPSLDKPDGTGRLYPSDALKVLANFLRQEP